MGPLGLGKSLLLAPLDKWLQRLLENRGRIVNSFQIPRFLQELLEALTHIEAQLTAPGRSCVGQARGDHPLNLPLGFAPSRFYKIASLGIDEIAQMRCDDHDAGQRKFSTLKMLENRRVRRGSSRHIDPLVSDIRRESQLRSA